MSYVRMPLMLLTLAWPTLVMAGVGPAQPGAPVNQYGALLLTPLGAPLNYTQAQLAAQQARCTATSPGTTMVPNRPIGAGQDGLGPTAHWNWFAFGTGIGASKISVSRRGLVSEIILGGGGSGFGGDRYWFILAHDRRRGVYEQAFVSPVVASGVTIERIAVGDLGGQAGAEIVVGDSTGAIEVWHQASRTRIRRFQTQTNGVQAIALADVDGDKTTEIVVTSTNSLLVYAPDGTLEWSLASVGGDDVVVAQMDNDLPLEIATADGNIVDAGTRKVQWYWSKGFGIDLEAADIDNDGMDELIGALAWNYIWAYDVDRQLPKWSLASFNQSSIKAVDIDNDKVIELIVGEAQWGSMTAYDTVTLAKEWAIKNPEHGTTDVHFGDVDQDGTVEILWGAGWSSTGADVFYVADWKTQSIEWKSDHLEGPFRGPVVGDVDGDRLPDLVTVCNKSSTGSGGGRILVFDGVTLQLRAMSQGVGTSGTWSGTHEVELVNLDGDAALEIVVATSSTYDGIIEAYDFDGSTFKRIWRNPSPFPDGPFRQVEVADVDGDKNLEVVGAADDYFYVYDWTKGTQEWRSPVFIANNIPGLEIANTDNDPSLEILALGSDGFLYVFDGTTHQLDAVIQGSFTAVRTYNVGTYDLILLGDKNGRLWAYNYDAKSGKYQSPGGAHVAFAPIDGFTIYPPVTWFLGAGEKLILFVGSLRIWESTRYGAYFGTHMDILFTIPMGVSAGRYGLSGFKP
jgi:hypothetical protein